MRFSHRFGAAITVLVVGACTTPGPLVDQLANADPIAAEPQTTGSPATAAPNTTVPSPAPVVGGPSLGAVGGRWVRLSGNLLGDSVESFIPLVQRAKAAGADTILFSDTKTSNFYAQTYRQQWLAKMRELQSAVRAEGLAFVVTTASVGYCQPILQLDPTLVSSMPTVEMPLIVTGGTLVPVQTATVTNGSVEASTSATDANGWRLFDDPGTAVQIDRQAASDGLASLRFEGAVATNESKMARAATTVSVLPFQHYVLRYSFRADTLTAGFIGPVLRGEGTDITLTNQFPSFGQDDGARRYTQGATDLTTGWVEMELAFNSREFEAVEVIFGSWSTTAGVQWIDNVRVEAEPMLNIVRRNSLPVTLRTSGGAAVVEGVDVDALIDPVAGTVPYTGSFETYHDAPTIDVRPGGKLREGDTVLLSAWNATVTAEGQAGCAWNEPRTFGLMRRMHRQVAQLIKPDGILIDVEETRTGGWEPADVAFGSSGAAFANHVSRVVNDAHAVVGGIPLFIWNDMLDPTMNAVADYYQVNGSLEGSWVGVDPSKVRVINWRSGDDLRVDGADGVAHFAELGFEQIIAGFYDEDVADNHAAWVTAVSGQPGIVGSMYTTWVNDYAKIDGFAALWWRT